MLIIGFGTRQGTGKDTAAEFLRQEFWRHRPDLSVKCVGFADPMKDAAHLFYKWAGLQPRKFYEKHPERKNDFLPDLDMTVRQVWIKFGLAIRKVHPYTLINFVAKNYKCDVLIVRDVRDPYETEVIHGANGVLVEMLRQSAPVSNDDLDSALDDFHDWDYHLPNNGTKADLKRLVGTLYKFVAERLP